MLLKSFSFPQFSNAGLEDTPPALTHSPHLSCLVPVLIVFLTAEGSFPFYDLSHNPKYSGSTHLPSTGNRGNVYIYNR